MEGTSRTMWRQPPFYYSGGALRFVKRNILSDPMTAPDTPTDILVTRPKRADARRNYDKVIAAAREAFAEGGAATSLEEIARRAGVGTGTLYRNFPNRQALLEAVYVGELDGLCRAAGELEDLEPWDALVGWLRRFVGYMA